MNEQQKVERVIELYNSFGQGDINSILARLTVDVSWKSHFEPIVPWAGDFSGIENVPKFFNAIFTTVEVLGFEPKEFVAQGDTVVSMGTFEAKSLLTGKSANTPWVFVWKFRDSKICSYEQFHDPSFAEIFR